MKHIVSDALVVRTVAYGESDVIVTLLTESDGKIGALVRSGRKSTRRVGGALEPFHSIEVHLDDRGGELATLREARITRMRHGIVASYEALEAAGMALRWARHALPARTREPQAWETIVGLLDALDDGTSGRSPRVELAGAALRLLTDVGYALDLERCVRCGKECPDGRPAQVDAGRGGLVCSRCGGAHVLLDPAARAVARAAQAGERVAMSEKEAEVILAIAGDAMAAHAGFDR